MSDRNWIEISVAVAALVVSGISLWIGVRTEVANEEMVAATTWPLLFYQPSNRLPSPNGSTTALTLVNGGAGPAKIETLEIFYHGQRMTSLEGFLRQCCGGRMPGLANSTPAPAVLRAGQSLNFIALRNTSANPEAERALYKAGNEIRLRACYCSVLNRCWVSNLQTLNPRPVDQCPVPKVPYRG